MSPFLLTDWTLFAKTAFGSLTGGGGGFTLLGPLRHGCGGGGDGGMGFGLFCCSLASGFWLGGLLFGNLVEASVASNDTDASQLVERILEANCRKAAC